jgi:hypothetical protein
LGWEGVSVRMLEVIVVGIGPVSGRATDGEWGQLDRVGNGEVHPDEEEGYPEEQPHTVAHYRLSNIEVFMTAILILSTA